MKTSKMACWVVLLLMAFAITFCFLNCKTPPSEQKKQQQPIASTSHPDTALHVGHKDRVQTVAFSPDGKTIASGSADGKVILWDAQTGKLKRTLTELGWLVTTVAFSPDSKIIAGGGFIGVILWDSQTGEVKSKLRGHEGPVRSVAFSPDSKMVVSGSDDMMVILWDAQTGIVKQGLKGFEDPISSVAFSPDGKTIAICSVENPRLEPRNVNMWLRTTIRLLDVKMWKVKRELGGNEVGIYSVAFSSNGKMIAAGSGSGSVILLDAQTLKVKRTLIGHGSDNRVNSVAFSSDGKTVAGGSWGKPMQLWDLQTGKVKHMLAGYKGDTNSLAFSPDGKTVVGAGEDKSVRLWNLQTGEMIQKFGGIQPL